MKKNLKYIFLLAFMLSACNSDFLNLKPTASITLESYYQNADQVRANTATLYTIPWFDFNNRLFWDVGDIASGNIYYTYAAEGQFFYNTVTDQNADASTGWTSLYRVISYANAVISNMPSRAASNGVSQSVINGALGEAYCIRAIAYYFLAEIFGDVPIVTNNAGDIASNNLKKPRNTRASIYELMKRDLTFAAANLPTTDDAGRVTQWTAKGMLAKLYLTMAQNLSDPNSSDYFTQAKNYAADVIQNSGLKLMTNYADLFDYTQNNNQESLFAFQWIAGSYGQGNSRQANWARSSIITGNSECWGGYISATYDLVQLMDSSSFQGDSRRSSIIMELGNHYPNIDKADGGYTYNLITKNAAGSTVEAAAPVLNNLKKYVIGSNSDTNGAVTVNQATAQNTYVLRLADVYLIYAEAVLGANASTSDATALQYFNAIRARANLNAKTSSINFMDILNERRVEFAMESMFWFDLKRFYYRDPNGCLAYMNAQRRAYVYYAITTGPGSTADANTYAHYALNPTASSVIYAQNLFVPIPGTETLADPLLLEPAVDYVFQPSDL
jgi:hypothetical protein